VLGLLLPSSVRPFSVPLFFTSVGINTDLPIIDGEPSTDIRSLWIVTRSTLLSVFLIYKFNYILQVLIAGLFAINRQLGSNENWNIVFKLAGNLILKIPVNDHKLKEKATPSDEIALMQSVTDLIHLLHNILHWTL
jgi:hypothetical protein